MTEQEETGGYHLLLAGVDTLVLNVRYADNELRPKRAELPDELVEQFNGWQEAAKREEGQVATPLCFQGKNLLIYPHGAGQGQWRWLLSCPGCFDLRVSRGRLNGIVAQVRFFSEYLWSCQEDGKQEIASAIVEVTIFLCEVFGLYLHFQVSEVHLCADMLGWEVASCSWQDTFLSRARRRVDRAESDSDVIAGGAGVAVVSGRKLATLEFGSHGSPLSCVIYNKTQEIRQKSHDKLWFHDLWRRVKGEDGSPVWDGESEVWRVEFRFKREALHELKEEGVFHGIEDVNDLPERLEALWTYGVGHLGGGTDGLPDGWLRYAVPVADSNMARWPVHPAWSQVQAAFCEETMMQVNTETGEVIDVAYSSVGELIRERKRQVNIGQLVRQIVGCASTLSAWLGGNEAYGEPAPQSLLEYHAVLHWLHEHMVPYVMVALITKVSPEHPDVLRKKFDAKFAGDVLEKRVLYGLQTVA